MDQVKAFCDRWQVAEFALFGSVLRDDFRADSDIDVMVSFLPDAHPTLFTLVDMKEELQSLFEHEVDLVTRGGIENSRNPYRRNQILSTAKTIYEQGRSVSV
ncbi:nucleotidyltransferase [Myxacorys almedinensis A]|uniref:Nucleotidyltransferase n=2 Tax=Myxacorys TaxID=2056239 RepID=A0A8J7Z815_9CYAN|nr:nucleotidyltransferase family protein [Myxacorys almedinensis]NDJ19748.1 nucleotidyltransferase [Myxacorys almedinensis A]